MELLKREVLSRAALLYLVIDFIRKRDESSAEELKHQFGGLQNAHPQKFDEILHG